jgi:predicted phosphodiesterase
VAEPRFERVAVFGGVYSNHWALSALLDEVRMLGVDAILCLGDLGAFGPHPDRTVELIRKNEVPVVRGNYDDSLARGLEDCQCGYTDPRDNHFAHISYRYTFAHTAPEHREWMGTLPYSLRFRLGETRVLAFHGSPRRMNEFLWETTTPTHFLAAMAREYEADLLLGTHSGLHWSRALGEGRGYVNVGALGRPANDGSPAVWYVVLELGPHGPTHHFARLRYDERALAAEMVAEELPREFINTIQTGWWTTCLEILPGKERARGRF